MLQPFEEKHPKLGEPVYVHDTAVVIGGVRLADHVSVWPGAVVRGDAADISVGSYSNVQDNVVLHTEVGKPLQIGQRVTVGHGAILHACTVEDEVLIGMGSIVLTGAVIGKGAIIAAGALVTSGTVVAPGTLYIGSPAKPVRPVTPEEAAHNHSEPEAYWQKAQRFALSQVNDL